jgi:hypothetical protein
MVGWVRKGCSPVSTSGGGFIGKLKHTRGDERHLHSLKHEHRALVAATRPLDDAGCARTNRIMLNLHRATGSSERAFRARTVRRMICVVAFWAPRERGFPSWLVEALLA